MATYSNVLTVYSLVAVTVGSLTLGLTFLFFAAYYREKYGLKSGKWKTCNHKAPPNLPPTKPMHKCRRCGRKLSETKNNKPEAEIGKKKKAAQKRKDDRHRTVAVKPMKQKQSGKFHGVKRKKASAGSETERSILV